MFRRLLPQTSVILLILLSIFSNPSGAPGGPGIPPWGPVVLSITVENLNDSGPGSLREAVLEKVANNGIVIWTRISFQTGLTGTITLTSGEIEITHALSIHGPGAGVLAISGNNVSRIFRIGSGVRTDISGLTVKNGKSAGVGGGIFNSGTLIISNIALSNNSAGDNGGGIYNQGLLEINNSTLSGNAALCGGGTYNDNGTLTVNQSTLSSNTSQFGGGICNTGVLTMSNSTLSGNSAQEGGGIFNAFNSVHQPGTVGVGNSIVAGNTAATGKEVYIDGLADGSFTSLGHNLFGENGISIVSSS